MIDFENGNENQTSKRIQPHSMITVIVEWVGDKTSTLPAEVTSFVETCFIYFSVENSSNRCNADIYA